MISPVIILVNPQMGENIGAAARAMMNFGLHELRIVAPRDGWPNDKARSMAATAVGIVDNATLYATVAEAVADVTALFATTARSRDMVKPVMTAAEAVAVMPSLEGRAAVLFGPERTGLHNEDLTLADYLLTIPTAPENASLNLGQCVMVVAYELFKINAASNVAGRSQATTSANASPVNMENISPPATKEELQGFFDRLEQALDDSGFFKTPQTKPKMWLNLRNMFTRTRMSEQEVRTLQGVIRSLRFGK